MTLLTDLQEGALEPEYRSTKHPRSNRWVHVFTIALATLLITVAAVQTTRGAGTAAEQRAELLERISVARERQDELGDTVTTLDEEVRDLQQAALGDPDERARLQELELSIGATAVVGPGIVVVVGDAPEAEGTKGVILDGDIARLVNGLWQAGAEAISINGRRLTTLTPIRSAGAAITVDYVSLSPPYRLEVIGDASNLQARFNETAGAVWWQFLSQNYGITMAVSSSDSDLLLAADAGMTLRHAEQG